MVEDTVDNGLRNDGVDPSAAEAIDVGVVFDAGQVSSILVGAVEVADV